MPATRRPQTAADPRFFDIFDTVPVWVELCSLVDDRYLGVNRAFTRITGYTPGEVLGRSPTDLNLWAEPAARATLLERAAREGRLEAHSCRIRTKNGEVRHFLLSCEPFAVGGAPCLLSTLVDVTERRRAKEALARSEEKFATLFHTSPIWTLLATVEEGRYLEVNPAFTQMTGWTRDEVIGRTSREFGLWIDPAERDEIRVTLEATGRLEAHPCRFRVKSGEIRDFLWSAQVIDFEGVPCTLSGIQDITDLKRAEELYRTVVDSSLAGILIVRGDRITYVNPRLVELRGDHGPEDLLGKPFVELVHPDDRGRVLDHARRRYAGEPVPERYEARGLRADGATVWIELRVTRVELSGEPALVGNVLDISARKRAEEHLRHAQKMEAVGTLAGGIAHEFNNLLQVVAGAAQVMEDGGDPDRWLRRIRHAATRGDNLVKNLLQFSRNEEGERKPFDLNGCVVRAVELITPTVPRMIEVVTDLADRPVTVDGVGPQWEQVVLNLAANACRAMAEGGRLTLATRLDPEARRAVLTVTDNGQGMDAGTVERIYEPFFTTRPVGEGAGLGLAIVYGIVQAHGGEIRCKSVLGKGTVFEVTLPIPDVIEAGAKKNPALEPSGPTTSSNTPGGRILVVDDEVDIRDLAQVQLHRAGFAPVVVDCGEAALEAFLAQRFDLVILDLGMPGMGGQKCLEALRSLDPKVKVVVASGYGPTQEKEAAAAGAAAFVRKPYRFKDLLKVVQGVLGG